ncbi:MAG: hypothetical protein ACI8UO_006337 [Verrucomicrobiales bacterium]|jgi:hypothetical protein
MKRHPLFQTLIAVALGFSAATAGPDLLIEVDLVETSQDQLADLMRDFSLEETDDKLWAKVEKLLESGDAERFDTVFIRGKSGNRMKTEGVSEFIYPTEADPAESLAGVENAITSQRKPAEGEDAPEKPNVFPLPVQMPNPAAFETRNLGVTVEVDPVLGVHGKEIDLNANIDVVHRTGDTSWMDILTPDGPMTVLRMPDFYAMRITTAVTVNNGSRALIGTMTPHNVDGETDRSRKILVFIKASAQAGAKGRSNVDGFHAPEEPFGEPCD